MAKKWSYKEVTVHGRSDTRQNGCVLEHRFVAEQKIGRPLRTGEVVHHIDENRTNNNPDNLMVFKNHGDHIRFHHCGVAILEEDGSYICPEYLKIPKESTYKNICKTCGNPCKSKFCSLKCSFDSRRTVERPSRDDLEKMIGTMSMRAIGRKFNVTDNSIRKWAKMYGLPYKKYELNKESQ